MSELLFKCPDCKGYHFNITVSGILICTSVIKKDEIGCGWKGRLPSKNLLKREENNENSQV